jgi:hypothetical protein
MHSNSSTRIRFVLQGLPTYFAGAESFVTPFNATTELSAALSPNSDGSRPGNMNVSLMLRVFNTMSGASLQRNSSVFWLQLHKRALHRKQSPMLTLDTLPRFSSGGRERNTCLCRARQDSRCAHQLHNVHPGEKPGGGIFVRECAACSHCRRGFCNVHDETG